MLCSVGVSDLRTNLANALRENDELVSSLSLEEACAESLHANVIGPKSASRTDAMVAPWRRPISASKNQVWYQILKGARAHWFEAEIVNGLALAEGEESGSPQDRSYRWREGISMMREICSGTASTALSVQPHPSSRMLRNVSAWSTSRSYKQKKARC